MKVCTHHGHDLVILTRNEHCPPHIHVGSTKWAARFTFSFWENHVQLWDVVPEQNMPSTSILDALQTTLAEPANLRKARELWWKALGSVCLDNKYWDTKKNEVIETKGRRTNAEQIHSALFHPKTYRTTFLISPSEQEVEIQL